MKELKELTKEKRNTILLNCEPFFLDINKNNLTKKIYNKIAGDIDTKLSKELWCILTATAKALRYHNNSSYLTLRQQDYTTANKIHNKGISRIRMLKLIPILEGLGYITFYKGYKNRVSSYKSCFTINELLLTNFDTECDMQGGSSRSYTECIEIKTAEGVIVTSLRGYKGSIDKQSIIKYNKCLEDHTITLKGNQLTPVFKRVFDRNLYRGGRFYTVGSFQTLPKQDRQHLNIDNEECTELDYQAIHANILYTLEGVTLDDSFDPYGVEDTLPRKLTKFLFMCCLYSDNRLSATRAYVNKHGGSYEEVDNTIAKLVDHNSRIAHRFFNKDLWATLQYKDSCMAAYVIDRFVGLGKAVLCWHDSHLVKVEDRKLLEVTMIEAYKHVLGNSGNCKVTTEF